MKRKNQTDLLHNERLFLCGALELTQVNSWFWTRHIADYIDSLRMNDQRTGPGTIKRAVEELCDRGFLKEERHLVSRGTPRQMARLTPEGLTVASSVFAAELIERSDSIEEFTQAMATPAGQFVLSHVAEIAPLPEIDPRIAQLLLNQCFSDRITR